MIKLLYLAPQPRDTDAIDNRQDLQKLGYRLSQLDLPLKVQPEMNPRFVDLPFWLDKLKPELVHFSGHGTNLSKLVFVDDVGNRHNVPPEAVASLFAASAGSRVKGIVLNTCYSLPVAEALLESVDFAVSTAAEIQDESAIRFAETFYPFLLKGATLQEAFNQGRAQVEAHRKSSQVLPTLLTRTGISAAEYVLPPKPGSPERNFFVHYCRRSAEDGRLVGEFLKMLRAHRCPHWDVSQIEAGSSRADAIAGALSRSTHVILLISADAQDDTEWCQVLEQAIAHAQRSQACLVPVSLRPTLRTSELAELEHFPSGAKAVSQYKDRDALWVKLLEKLRSLGDGNR